MSKYIIFHHDDMDGFASAAIIKNYIIKTQGDKIESKINTYECNYEIQKQKNIIDEASITTEDIVYIVDFCFEKDLMNYIYSMVGKNMIWIDHHVTAIQNMKDMEKQIDGIRNIEYSATMLCWLFTHGKEEIPIWIKYIDTFDCWKNNDKDMWENIIIPFKYGMESQVIDLDDSNNIWDLFFNEDPNPIVESFVVKGKIIKDYIVKKNTENAKKNSYVINFEGKKALVINNGGQGSLSLDPIFDETEHDLMITYVIGNDKKIYAGLYTPKKDVHVGNIAKKFGGGGHAGAAGFDVDVNQIQMFL